MEDNEVEPEKLSIPDNFTYPAVGTMIGLVAVFLMMITSILFPTGLATMDRAQQIVDLILILDQFPVQAQVVLVFDLLFIIGYLSLFVGLYMLSRDFAELMSKLALGMGIAVGMLDLLENALLITIIQGMSNNWIPEDRIFSIIFVLNTFIDLLSYLTAILFALIFILIYHPWHEKFILGIFLTVYAVIGLATILNPALLIVRGLIFVLGMGYGTIILSREENIPTELLDELLNRDQDSSESFR